MVEIKFRTKKRKKRIPAEYSPEPGVHYWRDAGMTYTFREEFPQMLVEWVRNRPKYVEGPNGNIRPAPFPTLERFCQENNISRTAVWKWVKVHPPMADAVDYLRSEQEALVIEHGMAAEYPQQFATFYARCKLGYKDTISETVAPEPMVINVNMISDDQSGSLTAPMIDVTPVGDGDADD